MSPRGWQERVALGTALSPAPRAIRRASVGHPCPARGAALRAAGGGGVPEAAESAEGEDGAVWAGGEEPARQFCVSRASVPSGSAALTHPAASSLPRGLHGGQGLPWHTGVTVSPRQEPLAFPGSSHSQFCDILTREMPVAFPSVAQRCPWGCAGTAVPPPRAAHPAQPRAPVQGWGCKGGGGGGRGKGPGCPERGQSSFPGQGWAWLGLFPSPAAAGLE